MAMRIARKNLTTDKHGSDRSLLNLWQFWHFWQSV
jgi:hypothetical protein